MTGPCSKCGRRVCAVPCNFEGQCHFCKEFGHISPICAKRISQQGSGFRGGQGGRGRGRGGRGGRGRYYNGGRFQQQHFQQQQQYYQQPHYQQPPLQGYRQQQQQPVQQYQQQFPPLSTHFATQSFPQNFPQNLNLTPAANSNGANFFGGKGNGSPVMHFAPAGSRVQQQAQPPVQQQQQQQQFAQFPPGSGSGGASWSDYDAREGNFF